MFYKEHRRGMCSAYITAQYPQIFSIKEANLPVLSFSGPFTFIIHAFLPSILSFFLPPLPILFTPVLQYYFLFCYAFLPLLIFYHEKLSDVSHARRWVDAFGRTCATHARRWVGAQFNVLMFQKSPSVFSEKVTCQKVQFLLSPFWSSRTLSINRCRHQRHLFAALHKPLMWTSNVRYVWHQYRLFTSHCKERRHWKSHFCSPRLQLPSHRFILTMHLITK